MFEIGSQDTASGVVSSDVNLRPDDGEEYDDEDYDSVTSLGPEDIGTTSFPYEAPRRGDTGTYNVRRVLPPRRLATERPAGPSTERTRSFQLPAERFPQQPPQVIDVDEVEETEVGKSVGAAVVCSWTPRFPDRTAAGGVSAVCPAVACEDESLGSRVGARSCLGGQAPRLQSLQWSLGIRAAVVEAVECVFFQVP